MTWPIFEFLSFKDQIIFPRIAGLVSGFNIRKIKSDRKCQEEMQSIIVELEHNEQSQKNGCLARFKTFCSKTVAQNKVFNLSFHTLTAKKRNMLPSLNTLDQ